MIFHDNGPSEDCLYLNVWMPAHRFVSQAPRDGMDLWWRIRQAGGTSEPRRTAAISSKNGVIVVSMNYRLGIFGFFSTPESGQGIRPRCLRQLRTPGPIGRADVGE